MSLGCAITDLREPEDPYLRGDFWPCWRCTQPTRVIYYAPSRGLPKVFDCPHNRYAPHAGSDRCPHFEEIEGYRELWE